MKKYLNIDSINKRIFKLFNNKKSYLIPLFYGDKELENDKDILFVGLNPAGDINGFKKIGKNGISNKDMEEIKEDMNNKTEYKKYYGPYLTHFSDEKFNGNYNIIDLFPYRGTKQNDVIHEVNKNYDFFNQQYNIFIDLVKLIEPKIIVVTNGYASKYLKNKFFNDEEQVIDYKKGFWEYKFKDKDIPIIFTGMLSGQRAMDIGSREMLKFNIHRILGLDV